MSFVTNVFTKCAQLGAVDKCILMQAIQSTMRILNGTSFCVLQIHAGVNHLGHFLLVNLLRSHGNPRVVVVSSGLSGSGIEN